MESLPSDIVLDIVSRVPAECVLECKLVCKTWETLIRCSGSNFTNMHLSRLLNHLHGSEHKDDNIAARVEPCLFFACRVEDPDKYRSLLFHGGQLSDRFGIDEKYIYNQNLKRICHPPMHNNILHYHLVGSCNGLICAFQHRHLFTDPIYICNPLTREYVYLPQLVISRYDIGIRDRVACGFGYVRSTNEYKVVRIRYSEFGSYEGNVEVYTLGSGCGWRAICKVSSYLIDGSRNATGTYANGAIYWTSCRQIVSFDLVKEEFQLLPVPHCMRNRQSSDRCGLVVLGRHLCLYMDNKLRMEIWSLMETSGDPNEAWCMKFDIDYQAVISSRKMFLPILLTKNGQIIFLYDESVLYCYDTKTTILKMVSNEASSNNFEDVEVIAHVNTFASMEALGENSKRYTVRPCGVRTPLDDAIDELDRVALGDESVFQT